MIQLTTTLEKFDSNLWGYHFPVPQNVAQEFIQGTNRRITCKINDHFSMQCALMPYTDGYFVLINQGLVEKLGLELHKKVNLQLEKDHSEYGRQVPESFSVLLDQDQEGKLFFDQLTPGKKRSLIYIVGKVKNIDSQLNKGLAILNHLKAENGVLNFRKLNQLIKEYNQRSKFK